MAHFKTRYRPKPYRDGGAVPLEIQVDSPAAHVAADTATAHLQRAVEAGPPAATIDLDDTDDASRAFKKQIEALRNQNVFSGNEHKPRKHQH
jgi:hypothetical protein